MATMKADLDLEEQALHLRYMAAMHAMQTGIAYLIQQPNHDATPKHLRVGVNSALITNAAMMQLLLDKGIITQREYLEMLCAKAEEEVRIYEEQLSEQQGTVVNLL